MLCFQSLSIMNTSILLSEIRIGSIQCLTSNIISLAYFAGKMIKEKYIKIESDGQ